MQVVVQGLVAGWKHGSCGQRWAIPLRRPSHWPPIVPSVSRVVSQARLYLRPLIALAIPTGLMGGMSSEGLPRSVVDPVRE